MATQTSIVTGSADCLILIEVALKAGALVVDELSGAITCEAVCGGCRTSCAGVVTRLADGHTTIEEAIPAQAGTVVVEEP